MGEDLVKELQIELMDVASFLAKKGLKFDFDPRCVGLSKDIKIKYFLGEFEMDSENKFVNFKENQAKIQEFFEELRGGIKEEVLVDANR